MLPPAPQTKYSQARRPPSLCGVGGASRGGAGDARGRRRAAGGCGACGAAAGAVQIVPACASGSRVNSWPPSAAQRLRVLKKCWAQVVGAPRQSRARTWDCAYVSPAGTCPAGADCGVGASRHAGGHKEPPGGHRGREAAFSKKGVEAGRPARRRGGPCSPEAAARRRRRRLPAVAAPSRPQPRRPTVPAAGEGPAGAALPRRVGVQEEARQACACAAPGEGKAGVRPQCVISREHDPHQAGLRCKHA